MRGMRLAAHEQMQEIYVLPPDEESVVTVKEKEVALHRLHIGKRDTRGVKLSLIHISEPTRPY